MKKKLTKPFLLLLAVLTACAFYACTGDAPAKVDGNVLTFAPKSTDIPEETHPKVATPAPEITDIPQGFEVLDYNTCVQTLLKADVGTDRGELGYDYIPSGNLMRGPRMFSVSDEYIAINDFYNQRIQVFQNGKFKYTIESSGREQYVLRFCVIIDNEIIVFESNDMKHYFPVYDLETGTFIREIDTSSISNENGISEIILDTLENVFVRNGKMVIQCSKPDFTATDEWIIDPKTDMISHNEIEYFGGGIEFIEDELDEVYETKEQHNIYLWHNENYLYTLVDLSIADENGKIEPIAQELRKYNRSGELIAKIPVDWFDTTVEIVHRKSIKYIDDAFYCILSKPRKVEIVRIDF